MTFSTYKQKFPSKNNFLWVQCAKFVCYVCFAAQIDFVVEVIENVRREIKNGFVRK